jgi:hypothetical protein
LAMNSYFTGLVAIESEIKNIRVPRGAGWHVTFSRVRRENMPAGSEVLIKAKSRVTAQHALKLILSSLTLYSGEPSLWDHQDLIAHNDIELKDLRGLYRKIITERGFSTCWIPQACALAARASRSKRLVYAITKYNFSVNLYSKFVVDLEPSSEHLHISPYPTDHVTFSHALVAAYSAIEDLGLELRASRENPSRIKGEWNPRVRLDLEVRLKKSGIDLNETLLWTVRSSNRKIEAKRSLPMHEKSPWSYGTVRDCNILLVDAIAYADWLRDCVASHSVKDLTKSLSPYDVINVQHLARRLILEKLGWWEILLCEAKRGQHRS